MQLDEGVVRVRLGTAAGTPPSTAIPIRFNTSVQEVTTPPIFAPTCGAARLTDELRAWPQVITIAAREFGQHGIVIDTQTCGMYLAEKTDPAGAVECLYASTSPPAANSPGCCTFFMRTGFDYEVTRPIEESEAPLRIHQSLNGKCFLVLQQHDQQPFPIAAHAVTAGHEDDPAFSIIDHLGSGVLRGYLRKGSSKDPNVWRRHWFVLKEDKIWYCKSKEHQFNCSHIPLVGNTCDEAPRDVCAPYCFEIHTSQRVYQLCASNRQDMHTWIKAIQRQIELSSDNDYIHAAELLICDEERAGSRRDAQTLAKAEASLEGLLCHARGFELLRRFIAGGEQLEESLNFLRDVRLYRERCENIKGSPEEHRTLVWAIAKSIVQQHLQGQIELNSFERAAVCGRADAAVSNPAEAQPPTELFATLQSEVLEHVEKGPYRRFVRSPDYKRLLLTVIAS
jgi:hypothetical protein